MLYISLMACLFLGGCASVMAKKRGKDPAMWFFFGIMFGVPVLLWLLFADRKREESASGSAASEAPNPGPAVDPLEDSGEWYMLDEEHRPLGPFSFSEVRRRISRGLLHGKSYVWNEAWPDWKRIEESAELKGLIGS